MSDNTLSTAINLGSLTGNRTLRGYVGSDDLTDYYRLTLGSRSNLSLSLTGMSADADLQLLNSSGSVIASSTALGAANESINRTLDAGSYYVRVYYYLASTNYDLNLTQASVAPQDSAGNTLAAARNIGILTGTRSFSDYIGTSDANDYYKFELSSTSNLALYLTGMSADADVQLLNSLGSVISSSQTVGSGNESLTRTLDAGVYYVRVFPYTGSTNYNLRLTQSNSTPVDVGSTPATASPISLNLSISGVVNVSGDQDWYSINLEQGKSYKIFLIGRGTGSDQTLIQDSYLRIFDSNSTLVAFDDDSGNGSDSLLTFVPNQTAVYYLSAGGYLSSTGAYTIKVQEVGDIISDNTTTTGSISANGQWLTGVVNSSGDKDWYKVNLLQGQNYVIELKGSNGTSGLSDPYLYGIYNSVGVIIAQTTNDDYGGLSDSQVTFSPTMSGTYYISAGAYGAGIGNYDLRVTSTSAFLSQTDVGQTVLSNQTLQVGSQGAIGIINQPRDVDWFKVNLNANTSYVINQRGAPTGDGSLQDPNFLGVYSSSGNAIFGTSNDDASDTKNSQVIFTPVTSGTYFLAAAGFFNDIGTYKISIETIASSATAGDIAANELTAGIISVGGSVSSTIDSAQDVDWFKTTLMAGNSYQVNLRGAASNGGNLSDPYFIGVYNSSGQAIGGTADDDSGAGSDSTITFIAPTAGVYYFAAGAYGTNTGSYTLELNRASADITAPIRTGLTPADNASSVSLDANLTISFDENVIIGSGNFNIYNSNGNLWRAISATSNEVSLLGNIVTINPGVNFNAGSDYYVKYDAGVLKDAAGNNIAALSDPTAWNFKTIITSTPLIDTWTIMVYVNGDNNLEAAAIDDLNEMESVARPASTNLYAMMDRIIGYSTASGNWTDTREGNVLYDTTPTVLSYANQATSRGEINLGQESTLTNFINRAVAANPADNYALIIWDHGGGLTGSSWDDTSNGDNLTMAEVRSAIDNSNVNKFDIVGFDACLMSMAEQAFDLRGLADYLVASEDLEPGDGWAYDLFLRSLVTNPNISAQDLACSIVDTYAPQYAGQPDITLAATDLNNLTVLENALDNFVSRALAVGAADWGQMRQAAASARPFPSDASLDYADLGHFMSEVAARVSDATLRNSAISVANAVDDVVIRQSGTVPAATGLSIYLPYGTEVLDPNYTPPNHSFLAAVNWDDFLAIL